MIDLRILTLHRGWVVIGRLSKGDQWCLLQNAYVIRRWGTSKGLGELALEGPNKNTILDKCGDMDIPILAIINTQKCDASKWQGKLK